MPFPHHDRFWTQTLEFLRRHAPAEAPMVAPDEFVEVFANVYAYAAPALDPNLQCSWVVVHKGKCGAIDRRFLHALVRDTPVVFANEVFVVFCREDGLEAIAGDSVHVEALRNLVATLPTAASPLPTEARLRPPNFAVLGVQGVRDEMNRRYSRTTDDEFGGYEHPLHWDRVRYHEVNRLFLETLGRVDGLSVLEIGCGIGRGAGWFGRADSYLGTDLSDVAVARAARTYGHHPNMRFAVMDAMRLGVAGASIDLVLGNEIVEHVQDAELMLQEIRRVLKTRGRFVFNSTNRDSLHLRMIRRLGYPEFRTTFEHFREFGFDEMCVMLGRAGFEVESAAGVFLHPYSSVPGVDARIQTLAFDDPEMVETLRELGRLSGPRFGFEFLIAARAI